MSDMSDVLPESKEVPLFELDHLKQTDQQK